MALIGAIIAVSFELGTLAPIKQKHPDIYKIEGYFSPITNDISEPKDNIPVDKLDTSKEKGDYVASKNGTKYYFAWCSAASRIKDENKVYFKTKELAEAKGLEPSKTCPGL